MKSYLLQPLRAKERNDKSASRPVSPIPDPAEKKKVNPVVVSKQHDRGVSGLGKSAAISVSGKPKIKNIEKAM